MEKIKNIFEKYKIAGIILIIIIILLRALFYWIGYMEKEPEKSANHFLNLYYSIEDKTISDLYYSVESGDNPLDGKKSSEKFIQLIKEKYSLLMTEKGYQVSLANRFIPGLEIWIDETIYSADIKSLNLKNKNQYPDGRVYFEYNVDIDLVLINGEVENTILQGEIVMKKEDKNWKVDVFKPNQQDIQIISKYKKSILSVINWDVKDVKKVELYWQFTSSGGQNADNSIIDFGSSIDFEMPAVNDFSYVVKIFDINDNLLVQDSFTSDFSQGKDVSLYILWDKNKENVILSTTITSITGSVDPEDITNNKDNIVYIIQKCNKGQIENYVELSLSTSSELVERTIMEYMLSSAGGEIFDVTQLDEYYIIIDSLNYQDDSFEIYKDTVDGKIYMQYQRFGRRVPISNDSYSNILSLFD